MILQLDESQNTEYKESWNDKYLEWICGFANAQGFKEAGMRQPEIELVDGGVRVTVWRRNVVSDVVSDVTSMSPVMSPVQLTGRQVEIIKMIQSNDTISAADMSRVLSVTIRTIRRDLNEMQEMGIITHEGNTSAGRWVILKEK